MFCRLFAISAFTLGVACDVPPEHEPVESKSAALAAGDSRTEWKKCYDNCEHIFFVCSADAVLPYDSCLHEFGVCMRGCDGRHPQREGGTAPTPGDTPGVLKSPVIVAPVIAPTLQTLAP